MTEIELVFDAKARRIYEAIEDRLIKLLESKEDFNPTIVQAGFITDIEKELKKIEKEKNEN